MFIFLSKLEHAHPEAVSLSQMLASEDDLADINAIDAIPLPALLFQTGYLTIQDYQVALDAYQLDFPNKEVRSAFFTSMLAVLGTIDSLEVSLVAKQLRESLSTLELNTFV